jgi:hypothetical protein
VVKKIVSATRFVLSVTVANPGHWRISAHREVHAATKEGQRQCEAVKWGTFSIHPGMGLLYYPNIVRTSLQEKSPVSNGPYESWG